MLPSISVSPRERKGEPWGLVLLGVALVIGFWVRAQTMPELFATTPPHAFSEDDHYHLRRVFFGLVNWPHMLEHDKFMSFPGGSWSWFTDGFDRLLILLCRLLLGPRPEMAQVVVVCSLAAPLLSILALPLLYGLARRLLGPLGAGAACVAMAILPAHAWRAVAGTVDHHCLETVLSLAPLLLAGAALDAQRASRAVPLALAAGGALGASLFFWSGAPLIFAVLFGALGIATLAPLAQPRRRIAALSALVAACLLVSLLATLDAPLGHKPVYVAYLLSRFQLGFAIALSVELGLWLLVGALARRPLRHLGAFVALHLFMGLVAALALRIGPKQLLEATAFVRSEGLVSFIPETQPLLRRPLQAIGIFSPLLVAMPLLLAYELVLAWRARERVLFPLLAWTAGAGYFVLTLLQERHELHFAPFAAILIVRAFQLLFRALAPRVPAERRRTLHLGLALLAVLVAWRPLVFERDVSIDPPERYEILAACDWMRTHTPEPAPAYGHADDPTHSADPAWSVLASWDVGKTIAGVCERPSIASPDCYGDQLQGILDSMSYLMGEPVAGGAGILEHYRSRYVFVVEATEVHWAAAAKLLGLPGGLRRFLDETGHFTEAALRSNQVRLHELDGAAVLLPPLRLPALGGLRLVHESRDLVDPHPVKVFERVEGAMLQGQASPFEEVTIAAPVVTNLGRRFVYRDFARADVGGTVRFRFPYGQRRPNGVGLVGPAEVKTSRGVLTATLPEDVDGKSFALTPAAAP